MSRHELSRHPFSLYWKGPVAYGVTASAMFIAALWTESYFFAIATLIIAVVGYGIYATGESSDLPGTAGKHNKNIPT